MFETVGLADLRVGGLDAEAATTLVTAGAPDLAPGAANQLVALTRGNPLALLELPRSLEPDQRAGIVPIDEPLPVGREIERAFSERARLLPPTVWYSPLPRVYPLNLFRSRESGAD